MIVSNGWQGLAYITVEPLLAFVDIMAWKRLLYYWTFASGSTGDQSIPEKGRVEQYDWVWRVPFVQPIKQQSKWRWIEH